MKRFVFYGCSFVVSMSLICNCSDEVARENLLGAWEPFLAQPVDMCWESSGPITVSDFSITTPELAVLATQYANLFFPEKVRSINFTKDDKLEVTYFGDNAYPTTEVFGTYRVISPSKLRFSPDVDKLLGGVDGINSLTLEGMKIMAKVGILVRYYFIGVNTREVRFYLDTETLTETKFLFPLLAMAILGNDANDPTTKSVLESVPAQLDKTSKIEIGFNYQKPYVSTSK